MNTLHQKINLNNSPTIILVRPQMGENIGSVARGMLNFGLSDLRIVSPRDGWPNQNAVAVASGAGSVLENAKIFNSTQEACADLNYIFATTARNRDLTKETFVPNHAIKKIDEIIMSNQKVGVLFGPERAGLENSDVCLAQAIISVPINQNFSSLNLAHCTLIIAYEWFNLRLNQDLIKSPKDRIEYASLLEVMHLQSALLKNLDAAGFFWPIDKKQSLTENLTNLLGRLPLTSADVRTLHGVIKALAKR